MVSGSSLVNQAVVTGESIPAKKNEGDFLYGGTRNLNGSLTCVVYREKHHSFYEQLLENVTSIHTSKEGSYGYVDTLTQYFVTVVILVAVLVPAIEQYLLFGFQPPYDALRNSITRCMTILVCACPCALGSATPSAIVAATCKFYIRTVQPNLREPRCLTAKFPDSLRKNGVILTGGASTIDSLARTNFFIFDKTGTLTEARFQIEKFSITKRGPLDKDELWTMVCALEESGASGHPVGNAIFSAGIQQLGESWLKFKASGSVRNNDNSGNGGLSGEVSLTGEEGQYHSIVLGNRTYLERHKVTFWPGELEGVTEDESAIIVHVARDGTYAGTISILVSQISIA